MNPDNGATLPDVCSVTALLIYNRNFDAKGVSNVSQALFKIIKINNVSTKMVHKRLRVS